MKGRIIIFTGKGGVGKTSTAAAHALKSASEGKQTLLVSTDMAHNLSDLFEQKLGNAPVEIQEHLEVYEIDPAYVMEHDFANIMASITKMLPAEMNASGAEEYGMFPGMEELFSLLYIAKMYETGRYDRIIVDCAPTGETLSLLKFPELLSWYMEKLFPIGKVAVRVLAPVARQFYKMELPDRTAMNDIQKLYVQLIGLQELLKNREITSVRLVTVPEKMIVEETKRNYMYMNLYDFNVDGLYINRVLPQEADNPFFDEWKEIQQKYVEELKENFSALPICYIPWYGEEVHGVGAVERISRECLTAGDLFEPKTITERETYEKNEKGYLLRVAIPGADKNEVELFQSGTDVVLKLGNFKRNIPLPNVLRTYEITGAKMKDGRLGIQFEGKEQ
ncbi:MAG: ArsA family ATPase [bacterium]|nr:ArsA family ATPase [bacterium]